MDVAVFLDPTDLAPQEVVAVDDDGTIRTAGQATHPHRDHIVGLFADGHDLTGGDLWDDGIHRATTELTSPGDVLALLTDEWRACGRRLVESVTPVAHPMRSFGADLTTARRRFADLVPVMTATPAVRFDADRRLSTVTPMWADDDRLVVAVAPFEEPVDVDRALAYGLAYAQDRTLELVLPDHATEPTLRRLAALDVPVTVTAYRLRLCAGRSLTDTTRLVNPAEAHVLARYDDPLVDDIHDLADRAPLVAALTTWADSNPVLVAAHRRSYLTWHAAGRQVLRLTRTRGGVRIVAGVHARGGPGDRFAPAVTHLATGPLDEATLAALTAAVDAAVERRTSPTARTDVGHREHLLQSALAAAGPHTLGLTAMQREFPAIRADAKRAYIDFLGVDATGQIHVVESKIGNDEMLVLQGLDYWLWARAHRSALANRLGVDDPDPTVVIDFVVDGDTQPPIGPYTAPQLEAVSGRISWRFHTVTGWDGGTLDVHTLPPRTTPDAPATTGPRFATRLRHHLSSHTAGPLQAGLFHRDATGNVVGAARWALEDLSARAATHSHVHHVASSQAFALNLFGPLERGDVADLLRRWFPDVDDADPPRFEWSDPTDRLGEHTTRRPHRTQVDVVLTGRTADGTTVAALVEVKLTETDFGTCSAYADAPAVLRSAACCQPGPFGSNPAACYQLRNRDTGAPPRRYPDHLPDLTGAPAPDGDTGCWWRGGLNQAMRNIALADVTVSSGRAERAVFVVCAHPGNRQVARTWQAARALFGDRIQRLDPATVANLHRQPAAVGDRYQLDVDRPPADEPATRATPAMWDVAARIVNRAGGHLDVVELEPSGGGIIYLGLTPRDRTGGLVSIAVDRRIQIEPRDGGRVELDYGPGDRDADLAVELTVAHLGAGQPDDIDWTVAVLARVAARSAPRRWLRNGMLDGTSFGGPNTAWFDAIRTTAAELAALDSNDRRRDTYWFVLDDTGTPTAAIDTTGHLHLPDGTRRNLPGRAASIDDAVTDVIDAIGGP